MKIVIELNDDDLRRAIEQQVGKSVSAATDKVLATKVDEIIAKKFERVDAKMIENVVAKAAADLIRGNQSQVWQLDSKVKAALADAAKELVRNAARNMN